MRTARDARFDSQNSFRPLQARAYRFLLDRLDRITFDPEQCGGRPCIRNMRIRVKDVLGMLAAGMSEAEILNDFPCLDTEDIRACIQFAADELDHVILKAA